MKTKPAPEPTPATEPEQLEPVRRHGIEDQTGEVRSILTDTGPAFIRPDDVSAILPTRTGLGSVILTAAGPIPLKIPSEAAAVAIWAPFEPTEAAEPDAHRLSLAAGTTHPAA